MKKLIISGKIGEGKHALLDNEDFKSASKLKWHMSTKGYVLRQVWDPIEKKCNVLMLHHFIVGRPKKGLQIDHINHDKSDNRKINLREVTNSQNQANTNKRKNNSSGFKGVHFNKSHKKWSALIGFKNKRYSLGYFNKPEDAAIAYNKKALEFFREYALINNLII